jgi:hypothetical protein
MAKADELDELAAELDELKKQAESLGMFTADRELLACAACGLKEAVTFEGYLYTCRGEATIDSGLRFPDPDEDGRSVCPGCGGEVQ